MVGHAMSIFVFISVNDRADCMQNYKKVGCFTDNDARRSLNKFLGSIRGDGDLWNKDKFPDKLQS